MIQMTLQIKYLKDTSPMTRLKSTLELSFELCSYMEFEICGWLGQALRGERQCHSYRTDLQTLPTFLLTIRYCSNDPFAIAYMCLYRDKSHHLSETENTHRCSIWCHWVCLSCHINFCISSNFMPYQMILAFHYNPASCVCAYVCLRIWARDDKHTTHTSVIHRMNLHITFRLGEARPSTNIDELRFFFSSAYSYFWCLFAC